MGSIKPNLFIIGAPKSGTTALAYNLSTNKEVFLPVVKEPRYFDAHVFYDDVDDYPIKSLHDYLSLYDNKDAARSKYRLDASVFNMYSMRSIDEILKMQPDSKFIIMLREPVKASVSMHKQRLKYPVGRMREVSDDFICCWNMIDARKEGKGYPKNCKNKFLFRYDLLYSYEKYVPNLINKIPKGQLFIGFYEDYVESNSSFVESLFLFLDLKNEGFKNARVNESDDLLRRSLVLSGLMKIVNITLPVRKKLKLTGGSVVAIRKFIFNRYALKEKNGEYDLSEVNDFFEKTNEYLKELKKQNQMSS